MIDWRAGRNRVLVTLHEALFRVSRGRLVGRLVGMPVIMLTTTGHASGQPRHTMLTVPVRDAGRPVLVASNGGNPKHPDWFLNLRADPAVEVTVDGRTEPMRAVVASAADMERLWPSVVAAYRGYAAYQARSPRDIPLVLLEPR